MKQRFLPIFFLLFIFSAVGLYAEASESELYVKTIYIIKVYSDIKGFRVDYQTSNMEMNSSYMPVDWFGSSGGYGEVIYGNHPSAPYMSVWYKDNKIDHFRLYVKKNFAHPSWGTFLRVGISEEDFQIEELLLNY